MCPPSQVRILLSSVIIVFLATPMTRVRCGFTDPIDHPHRPSDVEQRFASGLPRSTSASVPGNQSIASSSGSSKRQAFVNPNMAAYHTALASMANFAGFGPLMNSVGNLRTVMMGGMLYGLSLIPAVVLALGGGGGGGGLLSSLGLSKRDTSSAKMPLLTERQTRGLLQMLQSAFRQWGAADEECKQLFVCQMYRQVSADGVSPDLELFKEALLQILERGGTRRAGRAAEHLLAEYEHYFEAARMGMKLGECEAYYSGCGLSLYPENEGFQRKDKKAKKEGKDGKKGKDSSSSGKGESKEKNKLKGEI